MTSRPLLRTAAALTGAALAVTLVHVPIQAATLPGALAAGKSPAKGNGFLGEAAGLGDTDTRGTTTPSAAQVAAAKGLGVRWNRYGTPATISPLSGTLGQASGDAPTAARAWLAAHRDVLGLSAAQVAGLELVNNQKLADSDARAVLFRQRFGSLAPAIDGLVTVGVGNGAVQFVSSSLSRSTTAPPAAVLSAKAAWLKAALDVGQDLSLGDLGDVVDQAGWTRFSVKGLAQQQMARLRAVALADGTVRPVFESNVIDVAGGHASAWTVLVDAVTGKVLRRQSQVENASDAYQFQGAVTATTCGPKHPFVNKDANTTRIVATAAEVNTLNDVVVNILAPNGDTLASSDTISSPEVATYEAASIPAGTYSVQVCPFKDPTTPFVAPGDYVGGVQLSEGETPTAPASKPKWRFFPANPALDWSPTTVAGGSKIGCWFPGTTGCTLPTGTLENVQAPGPWDYLVKAGIPSFTTVGNNANTHEAWFSPLTPGGTAQAPVSPTREYTTEFTDAWNNSKCNPANLVPGGNDIDAATGNLFVAHNRMHDFSYYLGFTEQNYNLQQDNLGRNPDQTRQNDPEIGNVQAGAITGGSPSYLGRDNANQIALQDGIPGITNQYLFQPIAGAFYSPCTDGSMDMSITGHEYTHAISNRMVGGPDDGLTSNQGGAMGESWSDLTAMEYMYEHAYSTGTSPYVIGAYATGNKTTGIRDYALDKNPLNYSDYGFDSTGDEVHADGEIWNGTQFEVRQALVKKYDATYPSTDKALNLRCAQGTATQSPLPATQCPGNRRWMQLIFDSYLLQQGATSMLDARDAMLAADRMRFGGANQAELWGAFARRGMGKSATTPSADSGDPKAAFDSPIGKNATVTFAASSSLAKGKVYIGDYEARVTPVADTDPATPLSNKASLAPGTYKVVFVAPGAGFTRSTLTVTAGQTVTKTFAVSPNLASAALGAKVVGSTAGSLNASYLIDDTEATNWGGATSGTSVDVSRPYVTVQLAGSGVKTVKSVQVSAMLNPAPPGPTDDLPLVVGKADDDPDSGSRFTALRKFAIETCASACTTPSSWKRIFTSADNAFPSTLPRPVAPDLTLRSFDVPDTKATQVRLVALENQCSGTAAYAGEQDNDPNNATDCKSASDRDEIVHAAELQVFGTGSVPAGGTTPGGTTPTTTPNPTGNSLTLP